MAHAVKTTLGPRGRLVEEEMLGATAGLLASLPKPPSGTHWVYLWAKAPPAGDAQNRGHSPVIGFIYDVYSLFEDDGAGGWRAIQLPASKDDAIPFTGGKTYAALVLVGASYDKSDIVNVLQSGGHGEPGGWVLRAVPNNATIPGAPGGPGATTVLWQSGDPIPWWDSGLSVGNMPAAVTQSVASSKLPWILGGAGVATFGALAWWRGWWPFGSKRRG